MCVVVFCAIVHTAFEFATGAKLGSLYFRVCVCVCLMCKWLSDCYELLAEIGYRFLKVLQCCYTVATERASGLQKYCCSF